MATQKVLFVGQLAPPVHGVSVMNEYILSSRILKEEFQFDIVNLTTAKSIENIGKTSIIKYFKFARILLSVFIKLLVNNFHLAYITLSPVGFAFIKDSIIVKLIKVFKVPMVIHLHGKGINKAIEEGEDKVRSRYNKVFKGTTVIVLSQGLKSDIQHIDSYTSCAVVNNGIPDFGEEVTGQYRDGKVKILMLSNLIESKGALDLLTATKLLIESNQTNIVVTFAGSWGEEDFKVKFMSYIKEYNLEDYVLLPGPVYGSEKDELLAKSDLFVLPTYYENECFPLTILEAMMHHLPVVSTFEGAIPEIIDEGESGFLVDSKSPERIFKTLGVLIDSEELRMTMGTNSYNKFNRQYSLDIFEQNLLEVFKKINR